MTNVKPKPRLHVKDSGVRQEFKTGAVRDTNIGKGRYDLLPPIAEHFQALIMEAGATKYQDRNWEKGMPLSRFLDSARRHLNKFHAGLTDEDHLTAAIWNLCCLQHHLVLNPHLDDLPKLDAKQQRQLLKTVYHNKK